MGGHNWVKHHLADAATSLRLAIEGDLECKVAVDKAAVVASSRGPMSSEGGLAGGPKRHEQKGWL
eukprot:7127741-Heterocapsa_arctica.AAC.1